MKKVRNISWTVTLILAVVWGFSSVAISKYFWKDPVKAHEYVALQNAKSFVDDWNEINVLYYLRKCKTDIGGEMARTIRQAADSAKKQYGSRIDVIDGRLVPARRNMKIVAELDGLLVAAQKLETVVMDREAMGEGSSFDQQALFAVQWRALALAVLLDREISAVGNAAVAESSFEVRLADKVYGSALWILVPALLLALVLTGLCCLAKASAFAAQE